MRAGDDAWEDDQMTAPKRYWQMAAIVALTGGTLAHGQCPVEPIASPKPAHRGSFGKAVQIEGDVAVVADADDHTYCPIFTCSSGAVHVFRRAGGRWQAEAMLFHSRISERDGFGGAISLDGPHRFAASAPGENVLGERTGAVYIFEYDGEAWHEVAEILPGEPHGFTGFGGTLVLRGDTLVVGAPQHIEGGVKPGAAWVYRLIDDRWKFIQKLVPPDPRNGARFSNAMAMDGEWLMVGARLDDEGGHHAGAVYIYQQRDGQFEFVRKLLGPGNPLNQVFGDDVAINAQRMSIGAPNGVSGLGEGAAYVYELDAGEWRHVATLQHDDAGDRDHLGSSVALRGDFIVAGAPHRPLLAGGRGAAYVFQRWPDGSWRQTANLVPDPESFEFGSAVAADGLTAIVGSPQNWVGEVEQAGEAFLFDLPCLLCRADLDGDGQLTFLDFLAFQSLFAAGDPAADFDGSGALDFFDFLAFQNEFTAGCA